MGLTGALRTPPTIQDSGPNVSLNSVNRHIDFKVKLKRDREAFDGF
jgi:hypothetical protein